MHSRQVLLLSYVAAAAALLSSRGATVNAVTKPPNVSIVRWSTFEHSPRGVNEVDAVPIRDRLGYLEWGVELNNPSKMVAKNVQITITGQAKGGTISLSRKIDAVPPGRSFWGPAYGTQTVFEACDYRFQVKVSRPTSYEKVAFESDSDALALIELDGEYTVAPGLRGTRPAIVSIAHLVDDDLVAVAEYPLSPGPPKHDDLDLIPGNILTVATRGAGSRISVGVAETLLHPPVVIQTKTGNISYCETQGALGTWTRWRGQTKRTDLG